MSIIKKYKKLTLINLIILNNSSVKLLYGPLCGSEHGGFFYFLVSVRWEKTIYFISHASWTERLSFLSIYR